MKYYLLLLSMFALMFAGCVQKSFQKTVIVQLKITGKKDISTVGIRGEEKPLERKKDLPMRELVKDSLYEGVFIINTGYRFTNIKFTVDEKSEEGVDEWRKIIFSEGDTTRYEATFNKR